MLVVHLHVRGLYTIERKGRRILDTIYIYVCICIGLPIGKPIHIHTYI